MRFGLVEPVHSAVMEQEAVPFTARPPIDSERDILMAQLLVSVRSAEEARRAVAGGADVIDVKEPARGALGRADAAVWRAARAAVPREIPVSVALGELGESLSPPAPADLAGIAFVKLGLAGAGEDWETRWRAYRQASEGERPGPSWVAVAYADAALEGAPAPTAVLEAAIAAGCAGILLDTARKGGLSAVAQGEWSGWIAKAKRVGLFVALAGGLDAETIARLRPLEPDLFAVRGAACNEGDRQQSVCVRRVAELVAAARGGQTACAESGFSVWSLGRR